MQYAFCSNSIDKNIGTALLSSGVDVISVPASPRLPFPTCSHADMLMFKADDNTWIMEKETYEKLHFIPPNIQIITDTFDAEHDLEYPYDIRFNAALIAGFLFCREKYISPLIIKNTKAKIVDVKQGYAKCSMCMVDDHAFITSDPSLKKAGDKCGLDVLLISPGHIRLDGYNYGFIGGASALLDKNLFFFGNIRLHPDYPKIHDFIYKRNIREIILSQSTLYDYGGMLFV